MYWYNGNILDSNHIELEIYNPAFLYGATIFTTMRIYEKSLNHQLTNFQAHLNRLKNTIKKFNYINPNWQDIEKGCEQLLDYFLVLRITIFPDGKELIIGRNLPENLTEKQDKGITAWVANKFYQRDLNGYKTGNYLTAWLALREAQKLDAQEAILTNKNKNWIETSTGNLWGYKEGIWFTPSLKNGILPGIRRKMIIQKSQLSIKKNNHWNLTFIRSLEAIGYSNSVIEFIPFKKIILEKNQEINFTINPTLFKTIRLT